MLLMLATIITLTESTAIIESWRKCYRNCRYNYEDCFNNCKLRFRECDDQCARAFKVCDNQCEVK